MSTFGFLGLRGDLRLGGRVDFVAAVVVGRLGLELAAQVSTVVKTGGCRVADAASATPTSPANSVAAAADPDGPTGRDCLPARQQVLVQGTGASSRAVEAAVDPVCSTTMGRARCLRDRPRRWAKAHAISCHRAIRRGGLEASSRSSDDASGSGRVRIRPGRRALAASATRHPPRLQTVDTCAAESRPRRPTLQQLRSRPGRRVGGRPQAEKPKVLILGSGPNRIGQGIEFDYSCVHAATTLSAAGSRP